MSSRKTEMVFECLKYLVCSIRSPSDVGLNPILSLLPTYSGHPSFHLLAETLRNQVCVCYNDLVSSMCVVVTRVYSVILFQFCVCVSDVSCMVLFRFSPCHVFLCVTPIPPHHYSNNSNSPCLRRTGEAPPSIPRLFHYFCVGMNTVAKYGQSLRGQTSSLSRREC